MPTTPARAKYLKRRRAKLKKLKKAGEMVRNALAKYYCGFDSLTFKREQVYFELNYIMRQARKVS